MGHVRDRWKDPARQGKGRRWQVKYTVDGREKDGGSYDVKAVAERHLRELEVSAQRGEWVDPNDRTTVTGLCRAYLATRQHRPSSASLANQMLRLHIAALPIGDRRVVTIRPSDAQAFVTDRAAHLAPNSMRALRSVIGGAFKMAVRDGIIRSDPFADVKLPKVEREKVVPLTVPQVRALAAAINPRFRAMVITHAATGLRVGELLALRLADVDFLRRVVHVDEQLLLASLVRAPLKTSSSRRVVPLPDYAAKELAEHIRTHPPGEDGLIFHRDGGGTVGRSRYRYALIMGAQAAGLPHVSSHDLRHHYASVLIANGQSVLAVGELMGHENAMLVLTTYGHLMPGSEELARKAIEAAWEASEEPPEESPTAQGRPG